MPYSDSSQDVKQETVGSQEPGGQARFATNSDQALIVDLKKRLSHRRWLTEKNWWGALLYHFGIQWIQFDTQARRWRNRKLSPSVPTPVTNLFRSTLDTVKSAIAQHEPRFLGTPLRDDPRAIAAASTADNQLQVILAEGRFDRAKRRMLDWLIPTGNAIMEVVWDDGPDTGTDQIPHEQCTECLTEFPANLAKTGDAKDEQPQCPTCGSKMLQESTSAFTEVRRGAIRFDTHSPFEYYTDPAIEETEENPFLLIVESFTKEQVSSLWGVDAEGDYSYVGAGQMFRENVAAIASPGIALPLGAVTAQDRINRVTVMRAFIKYHKEYPEGAYIAMTAGGKLLEKKTPYPWKNALTGKKYFPLVHFRFGSSGGRAWGYTPADDLLPKQYQLNKAESLFTLIMSRMANPVWLIPTNTNPTRITGEIGIQVEYTPVGQQKPERVPGSEAPQSLVKYIQDIRQSFDELSGAFSAIRGRQVGTRTPVGTVQQLTERGFGRWATVFSGLEIGYSDLARVALEVWRANAKTPRVRAVRNAIGGYTFQEFLGADWDDGVDIQVESGSARPHTQQEKLQTYMTLGQAGILNLADQAQVIKILEDIGMTNLLPGVEEDTKAAYHENAEYMQWAAQVTQIVMQTPPGTDPGNQDIQGVMSRQPIMVNPLVDDHALHFLTHRRLCLTPEWKLLPHQVQMVMMQHMLEHKNDLMQSKLVPQAPSPPSPNPAPQQLAVGSSGGSATS